MTTEEKQKLFEEKLKEIFPIQHTSIINSHNTIKPKTFRVNTLVRDKKSVIYDLSKEGFSITESEISDGYICKKNFENLSKSNEAVNNYIYLQELSSMLPAHILEPKSKETILDFCAAPGSKTGQVALLTSNTAYITAVEKSKNRFFKMKELLKKQGVENVRFIMSDANLVIKRYPELEESFDKILVDAPCSNEGKVRLNDDFSINNWNPRDAKRLPKLQKGLLNSALKLLKKGGTLVYSTCTYSIEENEMVIDWALKRWSDVKLVDVDLPIKNVESGKVEWKGKSLSQDLIKTKRIVPNEYWNGFYVAKFKKVI